MSMTTTTGAETLGRSGAAITIDGVSKTFGLDSPKPFQALKPGEFVSIVGPSGCGKSTFMLMVAGLLERTTGGIRIGESVVDKPITDVGIAFQDHGESPAFGEYVDRIYHHFERLGVLNGVDLPKDQA